MNEKKASQTQRDLAWAHDAWRVTLQRCLRSLAAQSERDALAFRTAELKAKAK